MSDLTARLALPILAPSQAQKHVTHNEALQRLDFLVQMRIAGFEAVVPPAVAEPGLVYALGDGATAAWAGQDGRLAVFLDGAWLFLDPQPGWLAVEAESGMIRIYGEGGWRTGPERLSRLGLGTAPDPNNRLAVAARATLLSHAGADHRLAINKASVPDTASLLFQTEFSGRAEMGLAGNDDWSIKVSPDGSTWIEALRVDATNGRVSGQAVQSSTTDTTSGKLMTVGAFGLGDVAAPSWPTPDLTDVSGVASGLYYTAAAQNRPVLSGTTGWHIICNVRGTLVVLVAIAANGAGSGTVFTAASQAGVFGGWRKSYDTGNTVVDGSGFILEASPVLRVHADRLEEPVTTLGAAMTRRGPGHYVITGTPPLAVDGWQIRAPRDVNGQEVARVADLYWHDGALHLHVTDPAGRSADVPDGHFVMLRFWEGKEAGEARPEIVELTDAEQDARLAALRAADVKAECRAHILWAVDETEQANIAQASVVYAAMRADGVPAAQARAAVGFAEGDLTTAAEWKTWVGAMQAECRRAIAAGDAPIWPVLPESVAEMAARF